MNAARNLPIRFMNVGKLHVHGKQAWDLRQDFRRLFTASRYFHTNSGALTRKTEDNGLVVSVKAGSSATFALNIHYPPRPAADSPIIIFFRRGIPTDSALRSFSKQLSLSANAIAVDLGYPLSPSSPYPLPVHAALAGYDWIRSNLARVTETTHDDNTTTIYQRKIGVCGELIGGSLATMLGLTECHSPPGKPGLQGISAVAVGNPIVDWTGLFGTGSDTVVSKESRTCESRSNIPSLTEVSAQLTVQGLRAIRNEIFRKPEAYFDPFASPLLFFRTPSSETPNDGLNSFINGIDGDLREGSSDTKSVRKHRSFRKHPPAGSDLRFPHMRIEIGKECVLNDQGTELIELMRKSFKRTEDEALVSGIPTADRSFNILEREGMGVWDKNRVFETGQWLGEVLRKP